MKVDIKDFYDIAGKLADFGMPVSTEEDERSLALFLNKDDPCDGVIYFDKQSDGQISYKEISFLGDALVNMFKSFSAGKNNADL